MQADRQSGGWAGGGCGRNPGIVASLRGFFYGASFVEVGSGGFVPPHGQAVGFGEEVGAAYDRES